MADRERDRVLKGYRVLMSEHGARVLGRGECVVENSPAPGVLQRIRSKNTPPEESFTANVYGAASERPMGYPADLPFIPDVEVCVTEFASGARAQFWTVERGDEVHDTILSATKHDGWTPVEAPPNTPELVTRFTSLAHFGRGDRWRFVMRAVIGNRTAVKLIEVPAGRAWGTAL
jgi:hypothetical protein